MQTAAMQEAEAAAAATKAKEERAEGAAVEAAVVPPALTPELPHFGRDWRASPSQQESQTVSSLPRTSRPQTPFCWSATRPALASPRAFSLPFLLTGAGRPLVFFEAPLRPVLIVWSTSMQPGHSNFEPPCIEQALLQRRHQARLFYHYGTGRGALASCQGMSRLWRTARAAIRGLCQRHQE